MNDVNTRLRLRFEKTGRAVYISHLDLMQTLQRACSRAGYSLKYSEGFNPHPQISVALPLSVGAASRIELSEAIAAHSRAIGDCISAFYDGQRAEAALFALVGQRPAYAERVIDGTEGEDE